MLADRTWSDIDQSDFQRILTWYIDVESLDVSNRELEEGHHRTEHLETLIQVAFELGAADIASESCGCVGRDKDSVMEHLTEAPHAGR